MGRGDSRNTPKMKRLKSQAKLKHRIEKRKVEKQAEPKARPVAAAAPATKTRKRTVAG